MKTWTFVICLLWCGGHAFLDAVPPEGRTDLFPPVNRPTVRFQEWADYHISHSAHPVLVLMPMNARYSDVALCYVKYFRQVLDMSLGIVFYSPNVSEPLLDQVR